MQYSSGRLGLRAVTKRIYQNQLYGFFILEICDMLENVRRKDALVIYKQASVQFDKDGSLMPLEGVPVHTLPYDEKPGCRQLVQQQAAGPGARHRQIQYNNSWLRIYTVRNAVPACRNLPAYGTGSPLYKRDT